MPTGLMPTYEYRPTPRYSTEVTVRSRSSRRARLWAGGTYFRTRDTGLQGNRISGEIIVFKQGPEPGMPIDLENPPDAIFVVVNRTLAYNENVTGPAEVKFLDLNQAHWTDLWKIDTSETPPHAKKYSIRVEIRNDEEPVVEDLGPFTFDKLFSKDKISVQLSKKPPSGSSESIISIAPRYRFYRLKWVEKAAETEGGSSGGDTSEPTEPTAGWDIEDLRTQINANDPWIEMIERTPGPVMPGMDLNDFQDDGEDEEYLTPFTETYFSGGDGLPDTPSIEKTGPTRALVHLGYGEAKNGKMTEINVMYEWVGESAKEGQWRPY